MVKRLNFKFKNYGVKDAKIHISVRKKTANKTHGGKILIVAGSEGMWGAAILSAKSAARSGAGYVYLYTDKNSKNFPTFKHPDFLIYSKLNLKNIQEGLPFNAIALGPGFINTKKIQALIKSFLKHKIKNVVLDAEALNVLSQMKLTQKIPKSWILTPHEGELSRLIKVPSSQIRNHREESIIKAQSQWGGTFLLKGHGTLITDGEVFFKISSGNAALAKAGTGDVLTGMIAANLSQGLSPIEAACFSSFVHGYIADEWIRTKHDVLSLMATDIIELLPLYLQKIRA